MALLEWLRFRFLEEGFRLRLQCSWVHVVVIGSQVMVEAVAALPVLAGLWALGSKVGELRGQVDHQSSVIRQQGQVIAELQSRSGPTETSSGSVALRAFGAGALLVGSAVVMSNLLQLRGKAPITSRAVRSPLVDTLSAPTNYQARPLGPGDGDGCCVCMAAHKDTTLLPCRHFAVCWACANASGFCPVCRQEVSARLFAFVA